MVEWQMLQVYALVLPAVFLAGVVDAIAGGGGLLSLPAYLAAGLPPHIAIASNKFSATCGTLFAAGSFFKRGLIDRPLVALAMPLSMAGAVVGSRVLLIVSPAFLRYFLLVLIPLIALFTLRHTRLGMEDRSAKVHPRAKKIWTAGAALLFGFYDGFFGPATGTFLILFFCIVLGFDFLRANANTKALNLASNFASLAAFIIAGKVAFAIVMPAAVCGIAGNLLGARLALRSGNRLVRALFLSVLLLLLAKIAWDIFN